MSVGLVSADSVRLKMIFTSGSVDTQKRRVQHGHQTQTSAASFPGGLIPKPPVTSPPQGPFLYTVFIETNVAEASPVRQ